MAFPLTAFPRQRKLKCWFIYTPHCIGLQVRLDLSPGYGSTVMSGSVSGLHLFQTRQAPRAPLHGSRCYLSRRGVSHPVSRRYPAFVAPTGSCANPTPSPCLGCYPCTHGLCRLLPAPAGRRTFPTLFCESFLTCLDPYPGGPQGACTRCFPQGVGLPRSNSGSALHKNPGQPLQSRGSSRGCRHSLMFTPASLLATQVAPTAAPFSGVGQP